MKALRDTLVDASTVSIGLWVSYIFVLLYFFIALSSVTHRGLLLEDPIKLPFLNVDLPLVSFFALGPVLFILTHAYVLLHLVLFSGKVGIFHLELQSQISNDDTRAQLRWQLPSNVFVQTLAGSRDIRKRFPGRMFRLIAQISLIVAPVALLVFFQIQFLPYHPPPLIAFWLRFAVCTDLLLLWLLWPSIASGRITLIKWNDFRRSIFVPMAAARLVVAVSNLAWIAPYNAPIVKNWRLLRRVIRYGTVVSVAASSLVVILLVFVISTYPGEWLEVEFESAPLVRTLRNLMVSGDADEITGRLSSWFSNRLIVTDQSFVQPDKLDQIQVSRSFRGRELQRALLNRNDLRKADFTGARLNGASFRDAKLQNTNFGCLDTTTLSSEGLMFETLASDAGCSELKGADLSGAQLQGASLTGAFLQSANLTVARLAGADLRLARLQGANLFGVNLKGATLDDARLEASDITYGRLQGASLQRTQLQGATLFGAHLEGANLFLAGLQGSDLGKDWGGVKLRGAYLDKAMIWRASGDPDVNLTDCSQLDSGTPPWDVSNTERARERFYQWRESIFREISEGAIQETELQRMRLVAAWRQLSGLAPRYSKHTINKVDRSYHQPKLTLPPETPLDRDMQVDFLGDLSCASESSPYIARTIVRSRWDINASISRLITRLEEGRWKLQTCPGVKGFTDDDWELADRVKQRTQK